MSTVSSEHSWVWKKWEEVVSRGEARGGKEDGKMEGERIKKGNEKKG